MHPWRQRLFRWFSPFARVIPFTPNQITVCAFVLNLAGAGAIAAGRLSPVWFLAAPALVAIAGLLDALDGIVASVRGLKSPLGDFLDHMLDRIADSLLFGGWLIGTAVRPAIGIPAVIFVVLDGYAATQIEASFGTRTYEGVGRGEFVLALFSFPLIAWSLARVGVLHAPYGGLTIPEWMSLAIGAFALAGTLHRIRIGIRIGRSAPEPRGDIEENLDR